MKKIIIFALTAAVLAGCVNLDVPRRDTVTQETLFSNNAGMDTYMARLFSYYPMEDFKYQAKWGYNGSSWLGAFGLEGTGEAVSREGGPGVSFTSEDQIYWNSDRIGKPFMVLRDINVLLRDFPAYRGNFSAVDYDNYLGQAYFIRASVFYAMAKRFGGVPLVTWVIDYPNDEVLDVARSSEEDTWNQVLADFDKAIELLPEAAQYNTLPSKYVALAYKAEAMNYAGCVAKYNSEYGLNLNDLPPGARTGVKVIGFGANAPEASKKYFAEAYKAANEVISSGKFALYMAKWASGDRQAQFNNMDALFNRNLEDKSLLANRENMWVREYIYPTVVHVLDAFSGPAQFRPLGTTLSGGTCPTLDFVELFDGLPRNAEGHIKVTTGNTNSEGNYLQFEDPMELFANAEPRLRAYVILPNDTFKGTQIEVRTGAYTGTETDIAPFGNSNGGYAYGNAGKEYPSYTQAQGAARTLYLGGNWDTYKSTTVPYSGSNTFIQRISANTITASGASGPFHSNSECTMTGFHMRKWLNPDPGFIGGNDAGANAVQPFILMRYADVLLAAAESAVELSIAGAPSPDATDMLTVATKAIQDLQTRAGATVITTPLSGNNTSRDIVRKERRKELAFEHKSKWDIRRWRVIHQEGRDGFWGVQTNSSKFSDGNNFRFRGLYPFFSTTTGKFFFDDRFQYRSLRTFGYNPVDYYFEIPRDEVAKSMLLDQQPNRN
jgi:tetratricopeptide (TPR) repeat protein